MIDIKTKSLSTKLVVIIPIITVSFWIFSSAIMGFFLRKNIEREFTGSNSRILNSISRQSVNDLRFYDFYQFRRTLHDFYDNSYMEYFALYTADMKPFATYPATQFSSGKIEFIEEQIRKNANEENVYNFFNAIGERRFHFQQQVKDETGQVLGYLFMGGRTELVDSMVKSQIMYFQLFGFFVLLIEICALLYFTRRFTRPLIQLTNALKEAQESGGPETLISTVLAQPVISTTCSEVEIFDSVVRKLLKSIRDYRVKEMDMSVQATLGKLMSHFAHDVRSPLTSISHYLSSHAPKATADKDEIESYGGAKRNLTKIDRMADELTSYTKAHEIRMSRANMKDILEDVKKELSETAKAKGVSINVKCPEKMLVKIDADKVNRVVGNMVLNSVQAISRSNGTIDVSAVSSDRDLLISIEDNGCGIKQEHISKIFDSSFTFGKIKGTGLGLAYVKNVIDAHGGKIEVESVPDKGTKFKITLHDCLVQGISAEKTDSLPSVFASEKQNNKLQWMVIDDEKDVREQWREIITKENFPPPIEVVSPEALKEMQVDYSKIRGAIVDYNFKGSSATGFDVIEHLKHKGLTFIHLCTGDYKDDEIIRCAAKLKVSSIIPKPIPEGIARSGIFHLS